MGVVGVGIEVDVAADTMETLRVDGDLGVAARGNGDVAVSRTLRVAACATAAAVL